MKITDLTLFTGMVIKAKPLNERSISAVSLESIKYRRCEKRDPSRILSILIFRFETIFKVSWKDCSSSISLFKEARSFNKFLDFSNTSLESLSISFNKDLISSVLKSFFGFLAPFFSVSIIPISGLIFKERTISSMD